MNIPRNSEKSEDDETHLESDSSHFDLGWYEYVSRGLNVKRRVESHASRPVHTNICTCMHAHVCLYNSRPLYKDFT